MAEQKGIESTVSNSGIKSANVADGKKEENESALHSDKSPHHRIETHGTSDDIDEKTPIEEVKAPGVFQRVKEEVEALAGSIISKK